ncbi:DUF397 domain-containing protein [Streptomyces ferrugineus]|uniref:DUF397 domain-containing protein n=1 Tax=Streptomyces ferrugineus TaxID=1413221 RepID=A0A7M2SKI8_9ACTN|nr:DUF397 domain-containing protein [Streptomyces ferrugineus]QOV36215.1 DUF397 domain-containing protein [Streptomyces ferrugineus]
MTVPNNWRKSSYSGAGDGNSCVEVANTDTHIAIRDSKAPAYGTLTLPAGAFAAFLDGVKDDYSTVTDFARFRG